MDFSEKLIIYISALKDFFVEKINLLKSYIDSNEVKIGELEGMSLFADMANQKIMLKNASGVLITEISVGFLNNEGTTFFYNETTEKLELRNDAGEILSEVPASAFVSNLAQSIALSGANLNLKDTEGNVISSVTFQISNIDQLQEALDLKVTQQDVNDSIDNIEIGGRNYVSLDDLDNWDGVIKGNDSNGDFFQINITTNKNFFDNAFPSIEFEDNQQYTVTYRAINLTADNPRLLIEYTDGSSQNIGILQNQNELYNISLTSELGKSIEKIRFTYGINGNVKIYSVKIEKGNKATDYTPNPDDKANDSEVLHKDGDENFSGVKTSDNLIQIRSNETTGAYFRKAVDFNSVGWARDAFVIDNLESSNERFRIGAKGFGTIYNYIFQGFGDFSSENNLRIYPDGSISAKGGNSDQWNTVTEKANDNEVLKKTGGTMSGSIVAKSVTSSYSLAKNDGGILYETTENNNTYLPVEAIRLTGADQNLIFNKGVILRSLSSGLKTRLEWNLYDENTGEIIHKMYFDRNGVFGVDDGNSEQWNEVYGYFNDDRIILGDNSRKSKNIQDVALNDLLESGVGFRPNPNDPSLPFGVHSQILHSQHPTSDQFAFEISSNYNGITDNLGYRRKDNGAWNDWRRIWHSGIFDIADYATKIYVQQKIAELVDNSPEALNTLDELAQALGDDPNFATTVFQLIGEKAKDEEVIHKNGDENINDTKTFSNQVRIENVNGVFVEASNGDTARYGSYGAYWSDALSGFTGEFQFSQTGLSFFSNGNGIFKLHDYNNEDIEDFIAARFSGRLQAEKAKNPNELVRLDQVETNADSGWQSCTLNGTNTSSGTIEVKTKGSRLIVKGFYTGASTGSGVVFTLPYGYVPDGNRSVVSAVTNTQSKVFQIDSSNGAVFSEFESGVQFQVYFEMTKIIN